MLRIIALALSLMLSLGAIIPLMTNSSEASQAKSALLKRKKQKRGWKGVKKYSKRWWQLYRRQERRKQSLAARKRALQERRETLAMQRAEENGETPVDSRSTSLKENSATAAVLLPSGENAPRGWKQAQSTRSEVQYRVDDNGGKTIGEASIKVVGPASESDAETTWLNRKTLAGVSTSALRRTVIDQMMKEGGWVVNDYQKMLNGKKVFVVVAQSNNPAGQLQSRLFYFTELEGKIYSVSTSAPSEASERLAQESEKVINSLQRGNSRPTQAGLR